MNLIDRAAVNNAIESAWDGCCGEYPAITIICETQREIDELPTIEAVPLDALCEWFASWDELTIPCNVCEDVFQTGRCPRDTVGFVCGSNKHWKMLIKKWMEEQHDHN